MTEDITALTELIVSILSHLTQPNNTETTNTKEREVKTTQNETQQAQNKTNTIDRRNYRNTTKQTTLTHTRIKNYNKKHTRTQVNTKKKDTKEEEKKTKTTNTKKKDEEHETTMTEDVTALTELIVSILYHLTQPTNIMKLIFGIIYKIIRFNINIATYCAKTILLLIFATSLELTKAMQIIDTRHLTTDNRIGNEETTNYHNRTQIEEDCHQCRITTLVALIIHTTGVTILIIFLVIICCGWKKMIKRNTEEKQEGHEMETLMPKTEASRRL